MRILIVDDHAMIREALASGLKLFGHDVAEAADGPAALAAWNHAGRNWDPAALAAMRKRMPDVLVTDLDMPGMNGKELIARTRNAFPTLPIVAMTGGVDGAHLSCRLQKPFSTEDLLGAIETARAAA